MFLLSDINQHSQDDIFGAGIGLICAGLAIFLLFRIINRAQKKNTDNYIEATATIAEIERKNYSGNGRNYYYLAEFKTPGGEKIRTRLDHSTLFKRYECGQQIRVYYNPDAPGSLYTLEGKEQKGLFSTIQNAMAIVFTTAGLVVLSQVENYNDLHLVYTIKNWFNGGPQELVVEGKILNYFEAYQKQCEKDGTYLRYEDCDSSKLASDPNLKKVKNKYSFVITNNNDYQYSYINNDSILDGCLSISFGNCAGSSQPPSRQSMFLVLSKQDEYVVDDAFFNSPAIDSLGEFHLDSVVNNQFFGYLIPKTEKNGPAEKNKKVKIEYPDRKIIFEDQDSLPSFR